MDKILKLSGLKITKQRKAVINSINVLKDEATSKNIVLKCSDVDKSTIYRIIELFCAKGVLEKSLNFNNEIFYSLKEEHGHYFTCVKCHKKEKLDTCPLTKIDSELENKKGYKILNHVIQIEGLCQKCSHN